MSTNALKYKIAVIDKASKELKQIAKEMGILDGKAKKTKPSMDQMAATLMKYAKGGVVGVAVVAGVRAMKRTFDDLTSAYETQRTAEIKLEAALRATGGALGISKDSLMQYAEEMSKTTGIADETIIQAQALMTTFTQVGREVFPEAINAAADMSKMFGQDLQQSVIQLGTALNDPIAGVGRLKRIGISFTEEQRNMIKVFMEQNKVMEAQKVILDELNREFGGVTDLLGQDGITALHNYDNAVSDLKETLGSALTEAVKPYTIWMTKLINGFNDATKKGIEFNKALEAVDNGTANANQEMLVLQAELDELKQQFEDLQYDDPNSRALDTLRKQIEDREGELSKLGAHLASLGMDEKYGSSQTPENDDNKPGANIVSPYSTSFSDWLDKWVRQVDPLKAKLRDISAELNRAKGNLDRALSGQGDYTQTEIKHLEIVKGYLEDQKENLEEQLKIREFMNAEFLVDEEARRRNQIGDGTTRHNNTPEGAGAFGPSPEEKSGFDLSGLMTALGSAAGIIMKIASMSEDFGNLIQLFNEKLGELITDALTPIFEVLNNLLKPVFEILGNIIKSLTPVVMVIAGVFKVLGDLLLAVMPRLGVVVQLIGNMLIPIFKILIPIIEIFAGIMKILNPIVAVLAIVMDALSRPIQFLGDLLAWLAGWIAYLGKAVAAATYNITHPFKSKKSAGSSPGEFHSDAFTRKLISMDDFTSTGDWSSDTGGGTDTIGAGASYTAGRSTTVNVVVNTEVIAGEAGIRDLALMIRNEISAAEALGY